MTFGADLRTTTAFWLAIALQIGKKRAEELHLRNSQIPINMYTAIIDMLIHFHL